MPFDICIPIRISHQKFHPNAQAGADRKSRAKRSLIEGSCTRKISRPVYSRLAQKMGRSSNDPVGKAGLCGKRSLLQQSSPRTPGQPNSPSLPIFFCDSCAFSRPTILCSSGCPSGQSLLAWWTKATVGDEACFMSRFCREHPPDEPPSASSVNSVANLFVPFRG